MIEVFLPVRYFPGGRDHRGFVTKPERKFQRLRAGQHQVSVLFEDVTREPHGVLQVGHLSDCAGPSVARHDARIQSAHAIRLQVAAGAGVQRRLVLQTAHRGFNRIRRAPAAGEHLPPDIRRMLAGVLAQSLLIRGYGAAAAMNDQSRRIPSLSVGIIYRGDQGGTSKNSKP